MAFTNIWVRKCTLALGVFILLFTKLKEISFEYLSITEAGFYCKKWACSITWPNKPLADTDYIIAHGTSAKLRYGQYIMQKIMLSLHNLTCGQIVKILLNIG